VFFAPREISPNFDSVQHDPVRDTEKPVNDSCSGCNPNVGANNELWAPNKGLHHGGREETHFGVQRERKLAVVMQLRFGGNRDYADIFCSLNVLKGANKSCRITLYASRGTHRWRKNKSLHPVAVLHGTRSEDLLLSDEKNAHSDGKEDAIAIE
jgi:hypothetical protein